MQNIDETRYVMIREKAQRTGEGPEGGQKLMSVLSSGADEWRSCSAYEVQEPFIPSVYGDQSRDAAAEIRKSREGMRSTDFKRWRIISHPLCVRYANAGPIPG